MAAESNLGNISVARRRLIGYILVAITNEAASYYRSFTSLVSGI